MFARIVLLIGTPLGSWGSCPSSYASLLDSADACYYELQSGAGSSNVFWNSCVDAIGESLSPPMSSSEVAIEHPCIMCVKETVKLLWDMQFNYEHECYMAESGSPCGSTITNARQRMFACLKSGGIGHHESIESVLI